MAGRKNDLPEVVIRVVYYFFAILCFFFIFLLTVSYCPERIDSELALTLIIAILLLAFMLYTSRKLADISSRLDELNGKSRKTSGIKSS